MTSAHEQHQWVRTLFRNAQRAQRQHMLKTWMQDAETSRFYRACVQAWRMQTAVKDFYKSRCVSIFINVVIVSVLVTAIIKWELVPLAADEVNNPLLTSVLETLEFVFAIIFLVELILNAWSNWFMDFWGNGWSYLDIFVVVVSLVGVQGGTSLRLVRIFRAVRVLKLVKGLSALRNIVAVLLKSLIPVGNFVLLLLLASTIMAIVATSLFCERHSSMFGSFSRSLFTMWQVGTGDLWSEVVREIGEDEEGNLNASIALFFATYNFFVGVVLMNITTAVLLDAFITTVEADSLEQHEALEEERNEISGLRPLTGALDPLLHVLCQNSTQEELDQMIHDIFKTTEEGGRVTLQGLKRSLKKLSIHLNSDDWETIFSSRKEIDEPVFCNLMLEQIQNYIMRQHLNAIREESSLRLPGSHGRGNSAISTQLCFKFLQMNLSSLANRSVTTARKEPVIPMQCETAEASAKATATLGVKELGKVSVGLGSAVMGDAAGAAGVGTAGSLRSAWAMRRSTSFRNSTKDLFGGGGGGEMKRREAGSSGSIASLVPAVREHPSPLDWKIAIQKVAAEVGEIKQLMQEDKKERERDKKELLQAINQLKREPQVSRRQLRKLPQPLPGQTGLY